MIRPAILYKDEVIRKDILSWDNYDYQFISGISTRIMEIPEDSTYDHVVASVSPKTDEVLGLIRYYHDTSINQAIQWWMYSYSRNNPEFVRDIYRVFFKLWYINNIHRMEWTCVTDNTAVVRHYNKLINTIGGKIIGTKRDETLFKDQSLHDVVMYEILESDIDWTAMKKLGDKVLGTNEFESIRQCNNK